MGKWEKPHEEVIKLSKRGNKDPRKVIELSKEGNKGRKNTSFHMNLASQ